MTEIFTVAELSAGLVEDVLNMGDFETMTPDAAFRSMDGAKSYVLNRINQEQDTLRSESDDPTEFPYITEDDVVFKDVNGRSRDVMAEHEETEAFFVISVLELQD